MPNFSKFSGLLPDSQNTALKRKCKVSFVLCFVLKILFEKKLQMVRKMIPLVIVRHLIFFALFQYISTSFTNKYKYHFARFSLQFWVMTPLKSMESVVFEIKSYFLEKYNLSKLVVKSCSSFICSL